MKSINFNFVIILSFFSCVHVVINFNLIDIYIYHPAYTEGSHGMVIQSFCRIVFVSLDG